MLSSLARGTPLTAPLAISLGAPLAISVELTPAGGDAPWALGARSYTALSTERGAVVLRLDWDERLLSDLEALRRAPVSATLLARLGERLRLFLEPAGWSTQAQVIYEAAAAGRPAAVTLRLGAPELHALPWELLPVGETERLGELPGVLVHQAWPGSSTTPERAVSPSSGVLLAWSAAGGAVPDAVTTEALRKAPAFKGFSPGRDVLPDVTLASLGRALATAERDGRPYAALHLLAHAASSPEGEVAVALHEPGGGRALVPPEALRRVLRPYASSLRLVVLALCGDEPLGDEALRCVELGLGLHRAGHRSVVCPRSPLSVRASSTWSLAFYPALSTVDGGVGGAMLQGRLALGAQPRSADWLAPRLLARSADLEAAAPEPSPPDPRWRHALIAAAGVLLVGAGAVLALRGPVPSRPPPPKVEAASLPVEAPPGVAIALTSLGSDAQVSPAAARAALKERTLSPCLVDAPPLSSTGIVGRVFWVRAPLSGEPAEVLAALGPGEGIEGCVAEALSGLTVDGAAADLVLGLAVLKADSPWVRGEVPVDLELSGSRFGGYDRAAVSIAFRAIEADAEACLSQPGDDAFTPEGSGRGRPSRVTWHLELEVDAEGQLIEGRVDTWSTPLPPPPCLMEVFERLALPGTGAPQSLRLGLTNSASEDPSLR